MHLTMKAQNASPTTRPDYTCCVFQCVTKCSRPQAKVFLYTCSRCIYAHSSRINQGKRFDSFFFQISLRV